MADPGTIALAVKAAVAAASDKRTWKAVGVLIVLRRVHGIRFAVIIDFITFVCYQLKQDAFICVIWL